MIGETNNQHYYQCYCKMRRIRVLAIHFFREMFMLLYISNLHIQIHYHNFLNVSILYFCWLSKKSRFEIVNNFSDFVANQSRNWSLLEGFCKEEISRTKPSGTWIWASYFCHDLEKTSNKKKMNPMPVSTTLVNNS